MSIQAVLLAIVVTGVIGAYLYLQFFYVDFAHISGLPEKDGASLISGHLYNLGNDHASTAEAWGLDNSWGVFQIRLGNRRAIMLNSFDAAREWIVTQQAATIDRPWLYTFHGVVSKTSAATIGTNPWDERTKKQRRVVGSYTTGPSIRKLEPLLNMETSQMITGLYEDGEGGAVNIIPHIYQKRLALNIILMFCYAKRFEAITDPLLLGILSDANTISSFRSTNSNAQDYIPHLRYWSRNKRTSVATSVRERRDKWLATLLDKARDNVQAGKVNNCVANGLLVDDQERLTKNDIKTILGGLMSGGFETVYSTAIVGIGMLASPEGQIMQHQAYNNIMKSYKSVEEAFEKGVTEERSEYVRAFVREVLRFYPPLKLLPPRQTYRDFTYNGSKIPKGILVYMNAQAINRDEAKYGPDAHIFKPERWLSSDEKYEVPPPYHFSFGAGGRMCTAVNFSNRILYSIFFRLILSFRIIESKVAPVTTHYVNYNRDTTAQGAIPRDFEVNFAPRDEGVLQSCLEKSKGDTAELATEASSNT